MSAHDCDACTVCRGCGRNYCRDERPSPDPDLCDDCHLEETA